MPHMPDQQDMGYKKHTNLQVCQGASIPRREPMVNGEGRGHLPSLCGRLEACLSQAIVEGDDSSASS